MTTQPPDRMCPDVRQKLREVAERASAGPWTLVCHTSSSPDEITSGSDWTVTSADGQKVCFEGIAEEARYNAQLIALANPQTILALLDAYEASARDALILRTAMERLARAPGCGCSPVCRCGEGDWTRYELEGRMDDAQQALKDARHATQGD